MTTVQAGMLFVLSSALALLGVGMLFGFAALRGDALGRYTGNTILLGLLLVVVLPIGLGGYGIAALWGFWR